MKFTRGETSQFLAWLSANPSGFVVNKVGGQILALHRADCQTLQVVNVKGEKRCATDKHSLMSAFKRQPAPCSRCKP